MIKEKSFSCEEYAMTEQVISENITVQTANEVDPALLRMLDRGIEDVLAGRVLPHKEAMKEIEHIREQRKLSSNKRAAVG